MFAGGDMLFDRGVYETLRVKGKGADFPFDGGTAEITGHTCCSAFGWEQPVTRRTGNGGAMRKLIKGADLALANFENPAPDRFSWHTSKTVFTADPKLIDGVVKAGIDYVSIANNHIGDAGDAGILQTIANLKERGLAVLGSRQGPGRRAQAGDAGRPGHQGRGAGLRRDRQGRTSPARTRREARSCRSCGRPTTSRTRARPAPTW